MKTLLAGLLLTAVVAYSMHKDQDWSAGQGKPPRQFVSEYLRIAYDEGRGADAAKIYFAPGAIDHAPDSADRRNGAPIHHEIRSLLWDRLQVAVHHRIAATAGEPAMEVVDIYGTLRGRIVSRERIRQVMPTEQTQADNP